MRFLLRWVLVPLIVVALLSIAGVGFLSEGVTGRRHPRGEIAGRPLPPEPVAARGSRQAQILFGDLHVHTTYSGDAFIFSLPLMQGEGCASAGGRL